MRAPGADANSMNRHPKRSGHEVNALRSPQADSELDSQPGSHSNPGHPSSGARAELHGSTLRGVYHISIVAELVETHPQTLRMYERMGLVSPQRTRNNIRLYSEADVERVRRIQHLTQDLGVNLAGVEVVFKLLGEMERMRAESEARHSSMSEELHELREQLRAVFNEGLNGHEKSGRA